MREWFGTCVDITDLKRAEEALRESEERFRGTFENAAVGIAHKDLTRPLPARQREVLRHRRLLPRGAAREDRSRTSRIPMTWRPASSFTASLMRGESPSFTLEKRYVRKDGSLVWVELSVSLQRDAAGKPAYAIAMVQDISERKRLEGELRQAKEAAEAANRAKDEFLANVSHEIRTPMNAILGMTELALDTPLTEDQRQYLKTVKSAADSLLGIINDLLDFSKIEAGKLELDPADFSLRAALGDTLRALAVRAHKKGLELVCHVQPDVPDALVGDAGRLRQVLLNLVGNAIKFTEEGEVVVRVEAARRAPSPEGAGRPPLRGERHRHRHPAREAGDDLPGLRAGGHLDHAQVRRHRPGPDDRRPAGGPDGRDDHRGERAGPGQHLRLHGAVRAAAAPAGAGRRPAAGPAPRPAGAHRGRQCHQPPHPGGVAPRLADGARRRWATAWRPWTPSGTPPASGRPFALVLLDARMPDTDGLALAAKIRRAGPSCPPRGSSC